MVSSVTPRVFAEEANVEEWTLQTDTVGSAASDMAIKDRSKKIQMIGLKQAMPMSLKSVLSHESILSDQLVDTMHPEAMEIFPGGVTPLQPMNGKYAHGISQAQLPETTMEVSDVEALPPPEPTLNTFLSMMTLVCLLVQHSLILKLKKRCININKGWQCWEHSLQPA